MSESTERVADGEGSPRGAYKAAGVDIDAKYGAVRRAHAAIGRSRTPGVVGDIGAFGGLFDLALAKAEGELLVASTDGVGTKVMIANAAGRLGGVGADLVNHCVDDILVQGARPLFFLDYIAVDKMDPEAVGSLIEGLADACTDNGCALLGGETAEMPGVYRTGEIDVAGTIVGAVSRERLLDGSLIQAGDQLVALPSSGLHTNGYSLARRVLLEAHGDLPALGLDDKPEILDGASVADALLAPHRSYLKPLLPVVDSEAAALHGMAHVTGGGLLDNIPRVLHSDLTVVIDKGAVARPPIFDLILQRAEAAGMGIGEEAWRVFNMGFGMVLFVSAGLTDMVLKQLKDAGEDARRIGEVVPRAGRVAVELHG